MSEIDTTPGKLDQAAVILANLDELLDKERRALLDGDLNAISRGLREKERLIDALHALQSEQADDFSAVREKAMRNQVLLDGAMDGIRAAVDRMAALRRIRDTLDTYDQSGRRTVITSLRSGQVEKRA